MYAYYHVISDCVASSKNILLAATATGQYLQLLPLGLGKLLRLLPPSFPIFEKLLMTTSLLLIELIASCLWLHKYSIHRRTIAVVLPRKNDVENAVTMMAAAMGCTLGGTEVGYRWRHEDRFSRKVPFMNSNTSIDTSRAN